MKETKECSSILPSQWLRPELSNFSCRKVLVTERSEPLRAGDFVLRTTSLRSWTAQGSKTLDPEKNASAFFRFSKQIPVRGISCSARPAYAAGPRKGQRPLPPRKMPPHFSVFRSISKLRPDSISFQRGSSYCCATSLSAPYIFRNFGFSIFPVGLRGTSAKIILRGRW